MWHSLADLPLLAGFLAVTHSTHLFPYLLHPRPVLAKVIWTGHYDPQLPLILAADAFSGAVITRLVRKTCCICLTFSFYCRMPLCQGGNRSTSISFWDQKVSPIFVWLKIYLLTDHKALTTILGPKTGIPTLAASRLQ